MLCSDVVSPSRAGITVVKDVRHTLLTAAVAAEAVSQLLVDSTLSSLHVKF